MADRKEPPLYDEDDSMGTFQYGLPFYETMELFIQTLTGTCFQLRVSPFETVVSVKAKIQRLEGIPVAQQHLIWNNLELDDEYCLHDYSIAEGCTLKLVLAMRGGPINTRRVTVEEPIIKDVSELMEATSSREEGGWEKSLPNREEGGWEKSLPNREEGGWEKSLPNREEGGWEKSLPNKQVTFLVYRDGDQLNFFRVVDRGDGTLTPLSQSLSRGGSMYNVYTEDDDDGDSSAAAQHSLENNITMSKMKLLKAKMEDMTLNKKPKRKSAKLKPRPPVNPPPCGGSLGPPSPGGRHHHRLFRALPLVNQSRHSSSSTQLPPIRDHHHPVVDPPPSSTQLSVSRRVPPSSSSSCYMLQEEEPWWEEEACPPVARPPPKVSRLLEVGGANRLMRTDCVYPQLPPLATRGQHNEGPFDALGGPPGPFNVAPGPFNALGGPPGPFNAAPGPFNALGGPPGPFNLAESRAFGLLEDPPSSSSSSHGPPLFQDPPADPLNLDVCTVQAEEEEEEEEGGGALHAAPSSLLSTSYTLGIGPPSPPPLPSCASPCLASRGLHRHHHHHHQQQQQQLLDPSPPTARSHGHARHPPTCPGNVSPRPPPAPPPSSPPPRPARLLRCVKVESPGKRAEVICKSEARGITEMANRARKEPLGTLSTEMANRARKEPLGTLSNAQLLLASLASPRAVAGSGASGPGIPSREEGLRLGLVLPGASASGPGVPSREEGLRLGLVLPGASASGPGVPSREEGLRLGLALPGASASGPGVPSREEGLRLGLALPGASASGPVVPSSSSSSSIHLLQGDLVTQMSPLHRRASAYTASNNLGSAVGPSTSIKRLGTPNYHLPPVRAPMGAKKKSSKHCFLCGKKTGLASSYECRCSHNFCATHRYAETHDCTYDYKSAGRRLLQESNPTISTPKLPQI